MPAVEQLPPDHPESEHVPGRGALRFDVRDQILSQELLGEQSIVNNVTATFGMSVFLPVRN